LVEVVEPGAADHPHVGGGHLIARHDDQTAPRSSTRGARATMRP
jgi:hypothetical protein